MFLDLTWRVDIVLLPVWGMVIVKPKVTVWASLACDLI